MILRLMVGTIVALAAILTTKPAAAERRVALVVGNSAYQHVSRLDNPNNDARLVAETLRTVGFSLVGGAALLDLDKASFDSAIQISVIRLAEPTSRCFILPDMGCRSAAQTIWCPSTQTRQRRRTSTFRWSMSPCPTPDGWSWHQAESSGFRRLSKQSVWEPRPTVKCGRSCSADCSGRNSDFLRDPAWQRGPRWIERQ
ncbi:hypothetical protein ACVWZV_000948 [Bradyrhizobium sp. GM5.1]